MADEITLTAAISVAKGNLQIDRSETIEIDLTGAAVHAAGSPILSTTEAALPVGSVTTLGILWGKNLDTTAANIVELGIKPAGTFLPVNRWGAGEAFAVRLVPGVSYFVRSVAGTPAFDYELFNS